MAQCSVMGITYQEAIATVTAAGGPLEIGHREIFGIDHRVFVNAPPNLGSLFQAAPADARFLV